jgi:transcriptional regulator with XRE-family HTH domain
MDGSMSSERLKSVVDEKGIESAAEFARLTGLKESTARAYLSGNRSPPLEVCQRIGQALGVSGDWIYYGRGSREGGRVSLSTMATPSDLVFAAVEEAFLLAGFSPQIAQEIAAEIQLVVDARPRVPPGMSSQDVIRRLVRMQLSHLLPIEPE